jgi:DNA-binding NtrC family response regulator
MQEKAISNEDHIPDLNGFSILVIDDDRASLDAISKSLKETGAEVIASRDTDKAVKVLLHKAMNVIIAAIDLVDEKCIEMIRGYKAGNPDTLFYVMAGEEYNSVDTSLESVKKIVDDYIKKPIDIPRFSCNVATSIGRPATEIKSLTLVDPLVTKVKPYFLFRSPAMRAKLSHLPQIAASDQTVLITGETGSGKELVARAIHVLSLRSSGPFVPINCGAVPEGLIEGELFGHEKGAFTGAIKARKGRFETADKGTLFLDEISDMALHLQVRLLRALEEKKIYRVGAEKFIPVNARVISASNVDLQKAVNDGLFREDLYYRLNVLRLHLPPLRERPEDIPLLSVHFLERTFAEMGWPEPYPELSAETIYLLEHYRWKGNVRELRNIMTRIATLLPANTERIFPFHVLPHLEDPAEEKPDTAKEKAAADGVFISIGTPMKDAEETLIRETLKYTDGNKTKAASLLGVSLRNLRRKLNK